MAIGCLALGPRAQPAAKIATRFCRRLDFWTVRGLYAWTGPIGAPRPSGTPRAWPVEWPAAAPTSTIFSADFCPYAILAKDSRQLLLEGMSVFPDAQIDMFPAIESSAFHPDALRAKPERLDELKRCDGRKARTAGVTGVPMALWADEDHVQHARIRAPNAAIRAPAASTCARENFLRWW
jgi:hypothetical protein